MKYPNLGEERKLWEKGYKRVVGLDEAGRGPLAGPVVAAAVMARIFNFQFSIFNKFSMIQFSNIKDSKKLSAKKREEFYKIIIKHPDIKWGLGKVSEKIIDKINIKNAAELAMWRALKKLKLKPDFLIIDGNNIKNLKLKTYNLKLIVKGDEKVFSCSLASILAKVCRDRLMERQDEKYPQYGFDVHKGYPTKFHKKMLRKYGPCEIHRKSFRPVKLLLPK